MAEAPYHDWLASLAEMEAVDPLHLACVLTRSAGRSDAAAMKKKLTPVEAKARCRKRKPVVVDAGAAKLAAETLYVTGSQSLAVLHEVHAEIRNVSLRTLERASVDGKWPEKRREYREAVAKKALTELATKHAAKRVDEISALEELRDTLIDRMRNGEFEPKSFDSAVSGIVRLSQVVEGLRRESEAKLSVQAAPILPKVKPILSHEEARAAVKAVMRLRREEIRRELAEAKG